MLLIAFDEQIRKCLWIIEALFDEPKCFWLFQIALGFLNPIMIKTSFSFGLTSGIY